jgi:site-specific recombinase XerC
LLLRRYVAHLTTRRLAKRTIARKVAALRKYGRWLMRTDIVRVDPTSSLRAPAGDGRLPRVLSDPEITGLLDGPAPDDEPLWRRRRDDAVLEVLYGSGVRVSELCGLDLGDLRLATKAGGITVWGKGSKERAVPLSEPAVDALRAWLQVRHEVVPAETGAAVFFTERRVDECFAIILRTDSPARAGRGRSGSADRGPVHARHADDGSGAGLRGGGALPPMVL